MLGRPNTMLKCSPERGEERLVVQPPVDQLQQQCHPTHLVRQHRLPQRRLKVARDQQSGLPQGLRITATKINKPTRRPTSIYFFKGKQLSLFVRAP